jgi:hypothetical protein
VNFPATSCSSQRATGDARPANVSRRRVVPFRHALAGPLQTALGVWTVTVVKDELDDRTRTFTLALLPPNVRADDAVPFVVRVPVTVIKNERPETWSAELREELVYWISTKTIERGEMTWWPPLPG